MEKSNIKIFVITHKKYKFPKDNLYVPLHVGKEGKETLGYLEDNTGDNISSQNPYFCELTGLYWIWKNAKEYEYVGLNHYRRYFTTHKNGDLCKDKFKIILNKEETENILREYDIIVSKEQKLILNNVYTKYNQQHHIKDLDQCRKVIERLYPEYINSFDTVMKSKKICICNMFVCKKTLIDDYSKWLFDILFELKNEINIEDYTVLQKRVYGFLSERLFNVWLEYNKLKVKHLPILCLEHDSIKTIVNKSYRRIMKIKS